MSGLSYEPIDPHLYDRLTVIVIADKADIEYEGCGTHHLEITCHMTREDMLKLRDRIQACLD